VIARKDIDEIQVSQKSVMPEGLTGGLKPGEFRDLVRYVMTNPFLTEVTIAGEPRRRPAVCVHGRIPLPSPKDSGEVAAVVEADVTAAAPLRTRLLLGAGGKVQAWVNGKLVYDGKPGAAAPDQVAADVELKEGANRVVLKVTYGVGQEALYARLLDPNRKLRYPEPAE
jgi:hypothetical protein